MKLADVKSGETVSILKITDPQAAVMAIRLGIFEGEHIRVAAKIPGGPLVVNKGDVEIALGREFCGGIEVAPILPTERKLP